MKSTGWVRISEEDCKDLHFMYADQKEQSQSAWFLILIYAEW